MRKEQTSNLFIEHYTDTSWLGFRIWMIHKHFHLIMLIFILMLSHCGTLLLLFRLLSLFHLSFTPGSEDSNYSQGQVKLKIFENEKNAYCLNNSYITTVWNKIEIKNIVCIWREVNGVLMAVDHFERLKEVKLGQRIERLKSLEPIIDR